jgi:hypothetical protein
VRRYFSGQSGSHGLDLHGMAPPLYKHGARCGSLAHAQLIPHERLLRDAVTVPRPGAGGAATVTLFAHALGVLTSSCGTCAPGETWATRNKFMTAGATCFVAWRHGRSVCESGESGESGESARVSTSARTSTHARSSTSNSTSSNSRTGWTYAKDLWTWLGALRAEAYPEPARPAFEAVVRRIATGPWGAGVWWGNTLQYFCIVWIATAMLRDVQLDYYAYGSPAPTPRGGFCEHYQAQGLDVVDALHRFDAALFARAGRGLSAPTIAIARAAVERCSRCRVPCEPDGSSPVTCRSPCTNDFALCFAQALERGENEQSEQAAAAQ